MSNIADILENFAAGVFANYHADNVTTINNEEEISAPEEKTEEYIPTFNSNNEEVFDKWPTQKEVEENYNNELEKRRLQNQTHQNVCGRCFKASNQSGNPRSIMRYCRANGVMVNRYQACCDNFKFNPNKDPWEPD